MVYVIVREHMHRSRLALTNRRIANVIYDS